MHGGMWWVEEFTVLFLSLNCRIIIMRLDYRHRCLLFRSFIVESSHRWVLLVILILFVAIVVLCILCFYESYLFCLYRTLWIFYGSILLIIASLAYASSFSRISRIISDRCRRSPTRRSSDILLLLLPQFLRNGWLISVL